MPDQSGQHDSRFERVDREAGRLGYAIGVDEAPNMTPPITHMAFAHLYTNQPTMGRFLCYSTSEVEAAEAGLELLRRVVEHDDRWPDAT